MKVAKTIIPINIFSKEGVIAEKKKIAVEYFEGHCYICLKNFGKGFAYHHMEYDPNRKNHKDFSNTIEYNKYVLPEVVAHPERFRLLCMICHARIDQPRYGYLGHIDKERLWRLYEVARDTIPGPRKNDRKKA